jgi:hypothetical protein
MPYADGVESRSAIFRLATTAVATVSIAAGCAPRERPVPLSPSPGAARGMLPVELDASPVVARREWRWNAVEGLEVDTRHWRIRTSVRNTGLLASLPGFYEAALRNYRNGLVSLPAPPRPLESCVFGNRDEWELFTEHRLGSDAGPYLRMGRGGFTSGGEAVLYDIGSRDTLTIAAHEGWHQYSQTTLRNALPVWLEEGIACYMEGFRMAPGAKEPEFLAWRNTERYAELRSTVRGRGPYPLRDVLEGSPQSFLERSRDAQLAYYAHVWALVHFLRDGEGGRYRAGLELLLDDAVKGRMLERIAASPAIPDARGRRLATEAKAGIWLVLVYFDKDFQRFADSYERFARAVVDSNAWSRLARGQSPLEPVAEQPPATPKP